jgi:hypothetical protein
MFFFNLEQGITFCNKFRFNVVNEKGDGVEIARFVFVFEPLRREGIRTVEPLSREEPQYHLPELGGRPQYDFLNRKAAKVAKE